MCVVGSFRWQCVLLGLLGGKVSFLYVVGGNVCCMFYVAMSVVSSRW